MKEKNEEEEEELQEEEEEKKTNKQTKNSKHWGRGRILLPELLYLNSQIPNVQQKQEKNHKAYKETRKIYLIYRNNKIDRNYYLARPQIGVTSQIF